MRLARGLLPLLPALLAGAAPPAAGTQAVRVEQVLARLRANLAPLRDLSADVTVEVAVKQVWTERTYRQRYRYAFLAPSSIRLDYEEPRPGPADPKVKIARGRTVWVDGTRLQGRDVPEDASSPLSLWSLSLHPEALRSSYAMSTFVEPSHQHVTGLELVPQGGMASVARIRVWADLDRGVVEETKVFGAQGAMIASSGVTRFARVGGVWLPVQVVSLDGEGRSKTTVTWNDVRVNGRLSTTLFDPAPRGR